MRQFIVITDVRLMVFLLQLDIYAWCCSKHSCSVMLVLYSSSSLSGCWDTTSKFKEHVGSWVLNCSLQGFCGSRCLFAHDFGFFFLKFWEGTKGLLHVTMWYWVLGTDPPPKQEKIRCTKARISACSVGFSFYWQYENGHISIRSWLSRSHMLCIVFFSCCYKSFSHL